MFSIHMRLTHKLWNIYIYILRIKFQDQILIKLTFTNIFGMKTLRWASRNKCITVVDIWHMSHLVCVIINRTISLKDK